MKILLTGGAGFIGSHIVDLYLEEGFDVVVVDNLSSGKIENVSKKAKFYKADIRNRDRMEEIFKKERPHIVNHHAAQINVRHSVENPVYDAEVNIIGSLNLLILSTKYEIKRFIFASSGGAIYGEQEKFPADENHPLNPVSPYGVGKLAFEKYLNIYHKIYGIEYLSLRYSNVYGPRQDPYGEAGVVAIFCEKLIKNQTPVINGTGTQTRDFVYVADVAKANLLAVNKSVVGELNISTGIETSVNQLFVLLKEFTKADVNEFHGPPKLGEQMRSVLDNSKASQLLGWKPETELLNGLKKTIEFFECLNKIQK